MSKQFFSLSFPGSDRADSTWQVDAVGVRNYGSTMPECEHSVAALALYAFVAFVRMATFRWESP